MIPHHESAVEMAEIAQGRGESRFVKQLADDIVGTQNIEIDTLRAQDAELEQAGIETGELDMDHDMMSMDEDPPVLRAAEPFDRRFIALMIPHEGASRSTTAIERSDRRRRRVAHSVRLQGCDASGERRS
jgi:uncharacterized protein (DUF305 family)